MFQLGYILSMSLTLSLSGNHTIASAGHCADLKPMYLASSDKKEIDDPGKAITDDPHGPDPHGGSAHDEVHDANLPANNPDKYLKDNKKS